VYQWAEMISDLVSTDVQARIGVVGWIPDPRRKSDCKEKGAPTRIGDQVWSDDRITRRMLPRRPIRANFSGPFLFMVPQCDRSLSPLLSIGAYWPTMPFSKVAGPGKPSERRGTLAPKSIYTYITY
jgi:hypothetical protein